MNCYFIPEKTHKKQNLKPLAQAVGRTFLHSDVARDSDAHSVQTCAHLQSSCTDSHLKISSKASLGISFSDSSAVNLPQ